jgi:hypothetical protein
MKGMEEWRYYSAVLELDTRWGWVVSLTLQPLNPREGATGRHWIRDEMDPITGVAAMEMGILTLPIFEPQPPFS